jgi:enamine deaminase RidA (YjgF/YER057c/UK114 family)
VLHVSGQVAQDATGALVGKGDITAQTRQVLENIRSVPASADGTMHDVGRVTVSVTDTSGLAQIHEVRAQYFQRPYPASTRARSSRCGAWVKPE